jgi:hypothetical protein
MPHSTRPQLQGQRVKLRKNFSDLWFIGPSENEHLAWSGSRWVPIDRDGISASEVNAAYFASAIDAAAYAQNAGLEVEHG